MAKNTASTGGKNNYSGNAAGPHAAIHKATTKGPKATIHKGGDLRGK
jgi:hypothetical protein